MLCERRNLKKYCISVQRISATRSRNECCKIQNHDAQSDTHQSHTPTEQISTQSKNQEARESKVVCQIANRHRSIFLQQTAQLRMQNKLKMRTMNSTTRTCCEASSSPRCSLAQPLHRPLHHRSPAMAKTTRYMHQSPVTPSQPSRSITSQGAVGRTTSESSSVKIEPAKAPALLCMLPLLVSM